MSSSSSKGTSEKTSKKDPKLPWWVELLFVQIGLPDKWLPKILRNKNNLQKYIQENRKYIIALIFIGAGLVYINPHTKYFRNQNICIDQTNRELSSTAKRKFPLLNKSKAVRYCNGGILD